MNRYDLLKQARITADDLLKEKGYISFIDIFMKLGYLGQRPRPQGARLEKVSR